MKQSLPLSGRIFSATLLSNRFMPLFICLAGFAVRLFCIVRCEYGIHSDAGEFMEIALNLIAGRGYYLDGGTSAYRMPGYPLTLAFLNLISRNLVWLRIVQAVWEIAAGYIIYLLGKRHFGELPALIALVVWSFLPVSVIQPLTFMSEGLFTLLFVMMIYVMTGKTRYCSTIAGGLLCGALTLIKPQMLLFPGIFFVLLLMRKVRLPVAAKHLIVFTIPVIITLTPWILRNKQQFGAYIISTNGGQNLYVGNNPKARGGYYDVPRESHPELPIDREFKRKAVSFIVNNPAAVMKLIPKKIAYLFSLESASAILLHFKGKMPDDRSYADACRMTPVWLLVVFNLPYVLVVVGAVWASFLLYTRMIFLREIIIITLFWAAIHCVYFGASRFHYPLLPLFTLAASLIPLFKTQGVKTRFTLAGGACISLILIALWFVELVMLFRS
ncbi:MAG: glycosyltransferase family 39 protein [Chitinispirillaceae bacterium]|nr:glycosyltransferase family 39 protein [Chitinispirillaceae bacterium]